VQLKVIANVNIFMSLCFLDWLCVSGL